MSLSSRVSNMKFMKKVEGKEEKEEKISKAKDSSVWSTPVKGRTLKVLKAKKKKIRTVGYASINKITSSSTDHLIEGRRTIGELKSEKKENEEKERIDGNKTRDTAKEPPTSAKTRTLVELWKANGVKK
ncbi:hypothetical protein DAMA08_025400 [Martiniozyma asiatica (nom. inval.)]|nr:hypothetical protein DAMA08_025400 [Martiniozyma asiatica]